MGKMSEVVRSYYENNTELEWDRLNNPYRNIEFLSTNYLIDKYFPRGGQICDIGSGPGRYSIELLKKGYEVTLFELSNNELELAKKKISEAGLLAEAYICESAVNLNILETEKFDGILLMGPMYHLINEADRLKVLRETLRIMKKGGICVIAYLNSWGILKAGVTEFSEIFTDINKVYGYLDDQKFNENESFTEVYFSTPQRALEEIEQSGFEVISYGGAEGFLSGIELEIGKLYNENRTAYDNLVKVASETCEYLQYRDATEHLHFVVRKK
jgi:S-adenosylmethionine-dependent methyltransferase